MDTNDTNDTNDTTENEAIERDSRGRFLKGKKPGPGRPPGNHWLHVFRDELEEDEFRRVIQALKKQALSGSTKASALILRYAIPNNAMLDKKLTGELQDQLAQLKIALAEGQTNPQTASVLARIVALESVLSRTGAADGKTLSLADINDILNTEVDL